MKTLMICALLVSGCAMHEKEQLLSEACISGNNNACDAYASATRARVNGANGLLLTGAVLLAQ